MKIDPDVAKIYILVLKHGMKVKDIPHAWMNVQQAMKHADPEYKKTKVPGYVKMILKYSTEIERVGNGKETRKTKGIKE